MNINIKFRGLVPRLFFLLLIHQSIFLLADDCGQNCAGADCQPGGKTFFRTRSIIEDVSFFLGLNQYNYYRRYFEPNVCNPRDERIHLVLGGFFQQSRPNIGKFFFAGGLSPNDTPTAGAIESIITVAPERKVSGVYFDYHHDFCHLDGLWLDVKLAVYQATHNLKAGETVLTEVNSTDCTPLSFLSSDILEFGRIPTCTLRQGGVDDIEIKLGYYPCNCHENGYFGLYASALLPVAPRPTARFLFEPLVGRGHWGVGGGVNAAYAFCKCQNTSLTVLTDFSYQYLFKRDELRSLDFNQGQLTRFVVINEPNSIEPAVPAINLTTLNLQVEPRGIINFWLATHLQHCNKHVEIGYNLWWRQSEKVCLKKSLSDNASNLGFFDADNVFIPLTIDNLDVASARHPSALTNKIYLAASYDVEPFCGPINIGLAGSYEFSNSINAMEQWGVWVNVETSF